MSRSLCVYKETAASAKRKRLFAGIYFNNQLSGELERS